MREIEILAVVREDLHVKMTIPSQHDKVPDRIRKLMRRSRDTNFIVLEENGGAWQWYLWQFFAEAPEGLTESSPLDPTRQWLETTFVQERQTFRPFSVWWYDTGMMVGTRYKTGPDGGYGDVELDDPNAKPWFPFNYAKAKNWIPDLSVFDPNDPDGPPKVYNLIHDMRPHMVQCGQFSLSRGRYHAQRRVMQETTNQKLGSDAFGMEPWSPQEARRRRRALKESA